METINVINKKFDDMIVKLIKRIFKLINELKNKHENNVKDFQNILKDS